MVVVCGAVDWSGGDFFLAFAADWDAGGTAADMLARVGWGRPDAHVCGRPLYSTLGSLRFSCFGLCCCSREKHTGKQKKSAPSRQPRSQHRDNQARKRAEHETSVSPMLVVFASVCLFSLAVFGWRGGTAAIG